MDLTISRIKLVFLLITCIFLYVFCIYSYNFSNARKCSMGLDNGILKHQVNSMSIPDVIVQYGHPRTATTLQFSILCLIMALLHEDEIESVHCYFSKRYIKYKYVVVKTHYIGTLLKSVPNNTWIFMTNSDDFLVKTKVNTVSQKIEEQNLTVAYIADFDLVSIRRESIVYEYQTIFSLSDEQVKHLLEYFRYWDILRVCCGKQMSKDWKNQLAPNSMYKRHHDIHSSMYPACEMYDIGQVEKLMRKTYIFTKFANVYSLSRVIGRPSMKDGNLNGTYCERFNIDLSKQQLKMKNASIISKT